MKKLALSICLILAFTAFAADDDSSDDSSDGNDGLSVFSKLSNDHIAMGVSQFNYGLVPRANGGPQNFVPAPMKLANPGPVSQAAAVLVYNRGANPETFIGCVVREVTPHGAIDLLDPDPPLFGDFPQGEQGTFPAPPNFPPRYAETIWAPVKPVRVKGRRTLG